MDVSFLLRSPSLSLISVSSSRGYHVQPTVCASGERAEVKGERWMEGEKRMKEDERERRMVARARYNKYNGWASSWRESPGDFAGFCNWNAFRGRAKQGTRWINAALLLLCRGCLYFATRLAAERQLNEMSDAILVPSLPTPSFPFAVTLRYMRLLSASPESSTLSLFLLTPLFLVSVSSPPFLLSVPSLPSTLVLSSRVSTQKLEVVIANEVFTEIRWSEWKIFFAVNVRFVGWLMTATLGTSLGIYI